MSPHNPEDTFYYYFNNKLKIIILIYADMNILSRAIFHEYQMPGGHTFRVVRWPTILCFVTLALSLFYASYGYQSMVKHQGELWGRERSALILDKQDAMNQARQILSERSTLKNIEVQFVSRSSNGWDVVFSGDDKLHRWMKLSDQGDVLEYEEIE